MKLLIVAADYLPNIGGVSVFIHGIAESMALAGHQVLVLAPVMIGQNDVNLTYRVMRFKKTKRLANLWPSLITIYLSIVNRFDVIVYGHAASTLSAGGILARKLNITKLAVLTHGNDLDYTVSCTLDKHLLDWLIISSDLVLANSRYTKEVVIKRYTKIDSKVKVLNPGVWPEKISQTLLAPTESTEDRIVILTVARLVPKKSVEDLINAFALVSPKYPKAVLKIVGDGPEKIILEELALQLALENKIIFAGVKPANEVSAEMKQCSIFVMPSRVETFGIAYLEANACGKAVIGTRQGGVPDAVVDGATGVLVEPGNIQHLAEAMLTLIGNKELRDKMGKAGKSRVENNFNWNHVAELLETYISDII